ncbi:MAG TPA: cupin domain-containing protein [Spirochaetota bacterium]|nr:cupin domain-containing protein [Spirochaetota bacterium]HOL58180.1 cupin domain-containing protein [Spirochaetota bacterium]HPP04761.1 cupin domain-containing protein [Spirochaetota bacterium]
MAENVIIKKIDEKELEKIKKWPIWTCEVKKFDWEYDSDEHCYIIEGRVIVTADGKEYEIKKGDYVIFKKGLRCFWDVKENIKKHYNFY